MVSSPPPLPTANRPRCLSLLQSCNSIFHFLQIHAQMFRNHLFPEDPFAAGRVLEFLVSAPEGANVHYAGKVFDRIPQPTTFMWNTMIRCYASSPCPDPCLALFRRMLTSGAKPNPYTFPFILKACARLSDVRPGEQLHAFVLRLGADRDVFSINGLISMYAACGKVDVGRRLFDTSCCRDMVTWNSMISGYVNVGSVEVARKLFDRMPNRGTVTWNAMINGYAKCGDIASARDLFDQMPERNVESWNTLIAGYAKCGLLDAARKLFDEMPARNVVSWSAIITAYAQGDRPDVALYLFEEMQKLRLKPNWATVVSVLSACAKRGALEQGKRVHMYIQRNKMKVDSIIATALIDMYVKCGCIDSALHLFESVTPKDVFSWSAMIGGLAMNGRGSEALDLFHRMEASGVVPNEITFISVLCACSHGGWVQLARRYFDSMTKVYKMKPQIEHYGCVADALGRAGHLAEAVAFVEATPMNTDHVLWLILLGACSYHGNVPIGEYVMKRLHELKPDDGGIYVLLSNAYAMKGRWDDAKDARSTMEAKGLLKCPGRSSIQVCNAIHDFYAGDLSNSRIENICKKLDQITSRPKPAGCAPSLSPVVYDMEEEEEHPVFSH